MKCNLYPSTIKGKIKAVPSKSFAHRIIIMASFKKGKTIVKNVGYSDDVLSTIACMQKLGANIQRKKDNLIIYGIEKPNENAILDFNESGSTMRFLIPVVSALGTGATFTGKQSLLRRPNDDLYASLKSNGVTIEDCVISGKITGGEITINAGTSSQFVSGLIMAATILDRDYTINLVGNVVSKNYIDITLQLLSNFGVKYSVNGNSIVIYKSKIKSKRKIEVEGDWSSASFMLALGVLGKKVKVCGLNMKSKQGDKAILDIIKKMGGKLKTGNKSVTAYNSKLKSIEYDVENCPDLAPILSVLMLTSKEECKMKGVERLRIKESDRLNAIIDNLTLAGGQVEYKDKCLYISARQLQQADFNGYNDHRMVMSSVVLSSILKGASSVTDKEAVKKSYPNFFNDYIKLGGKIDVNV